MVLKKTDWNRSSQFFTSGDKNPDWSLPVIKLADDYFTSKTDSTTRLRWFSHYAVLLEIDGKKMFLEPMQGNAPAPHPLLGSKRYNDTLSMAINKLPQRDAVLISHDYYDHLDYESVKQLKDKVAMWFVPLGVGAHLRFWGVASAQMTAFV